MNDRYSRKTKTIAQMRILCPKARPCKDEYRWRVKKGIPCIVTQKLEDCVRKTVLVARLIIPAKGNTIV